jgi:polyisoprenoid-binding protein YceI
MNRQLTVIALLLTLVALPAAAADTWTVDTVHSDVTFKIRHLVSKVSGQFTDFTGTIVTDFDNLGNSKVDFVIKAASIDTRNDKRDDHLRGEDFFHVEKHPEITFTSTKITKAGGDTYNVTGNFTMHGVTKEITVPVTFLGSMQAWGGTKAGFELSTTINRKDFGMVWNKALDAGSYILGDEVEVQVNLEVDKK